ncbi:MAG: hypothetical protein ACR2RV_29335, partial [Verrucomicrobiales bacterium]
MPPRRPTFGLLRRSDHRLRVCVAATVTACLIAMAMTARAQSAPGELDLVYAAVPAAADGVPFMVSTPGEHLLVGYAGLNQVHRFDANGQVDGGYQSGPGADGAIIAAALQSSGKLLVAGHFTQFHGSPARGIVRLNPDGSVDTDFTDVEAEGYPIIPELITLPDDRILIAYAPGELTGFLRLLPDGEIDPTYDKHGFHSFGLFQSTRLAPDGSFYTISETSVARVLEAGIGDEFFGLSEPNGPRALAVQVDGKVIVGGYSERHYPEQGFLRTASLTRVLGDGLDDPEFELDGAFALGDGSSVQQVDTEPAGRIIASGSFRNYGGVSVPGLLRFLPDGRRDRNFDAAAAIPPGSEVLRHELMPDGQICLALQSGAGEIEIIRLHGGDPAPLAPSIVTPPADQHGLIHRAASFKVIANGFPDPVYQWRKGGVEIPGENGRELALEPLGLADAGRYSVQVSNSQGSIISADAVLTVSQAAPGQLDYSFVPELGSGTVRQLELAGGGKVLLGGHLLPQPDGNRRRLKQLNPDGSHDLSFGDALEAD